MLAGTIGVNDTYIEVTRLLNLPVSPDFFVWRTITPIQEIKDAVIFSNYTPANPGVGVDLLSAQNVGNWLAACSGKRDNLWLLLEGASSAFTTSGLPTSKANTRASLQDCTSLIPSGPLGANRSGGWPAIQLIIQRKASTIEKMFAVGTGTSASPADLVIEGALLSGEFFEIMVGRQ